MNIKFLIQVIAFFSYFSLFCQNLSVRYSNHLKGDMVVIGNTCVGRKETFSSPNKPYNDTSSKAKLNDQFNMQYTDIDSDGRTFSSSSAFLTFSQAQSSKVVYAGLYWSATYPYNQGKLKSGKYEAVDDKRDDFSKVLFKMPTGEYISISGTVLNEGVNDGKDIFPYLCYADVTQSLSSLSTVEGQYTLGNVRSAVGNISGGVGAGWFLVVVFENDKLSPKTIISYDGLVGVSKDVQMEFSGFKTLDEGVVNARLFAVAIEGDNNMSGDGISIYKDNLNTEQLKTKTRARNNFFNSSITFDDNYVTERIPNSLNTLGYDLFSLSLSNDKGILNSTDRLFVRLSSKGDRYSVPFLALSIESEKASLSLSKVLTEQVKPQIAPSVEAIVEVATAQETTPPAPADNTPLGITDKIEMIYVEKENIRIQKMETNLLDEGYYNIAGAFSNKFYLDNFIENLKKQGVSPQIFFNPEKGLTYVYVSKDNTLESALKKRVEFKSRIYIKGSDIDKMWILKTEKKKGK